MGSTSLLNLILTEAILRKLSSVWRYSPILHPFNLECLARRVSFPNADNDIVHQKEATRRWFLKLTGKFTLLGTITYRSFQ